MVRLSRLIDASRTAGILTPVDVKDILRKSQRNNGPLGVTGALILSNGIFLQCRTLMGTLTQE